MPSFPDLSSLPSNPTAGDLLGLPNYSNPFYWGWIFLAIWTILVMSLYFKEKLQTGRGNLLSSMAVSSFGILILSLIGTFVGFITLQFMVYSTVINLLMIIIWIWASSKGQ